MSYLEQGIQRTNGKQGASNPKGEGSWVNNLTLKSIAFHCCWNIFFSWMFVWKIKWYALKLTWIQKCNTGWCTPFLFLVETTIRTQVSVTFPLKGSCCGKITTGDFKHVLINVVLSNCHRPLQCRQVRSIPNGMGSRSLISIATWFS